MLPLSGQKTARSSCLEPIDDSSPIAKFLEKNPDGGMHHICFDVADLIASRDRLIAEGGRVLGGASRVSAPMESR